MTRRATGIALAFLTAMISGVSIYVNSLAVKHFTDQTVYTTAKNGVAGLLLLLVLWGARRAGAGAAAASVRSPRRRTAPALLLLALIGGSVPFVLFFEGLARAQATQAAFIQKTLVVWVAILAVPLLRERFASAARARDRAADRRPGVARGQRRQGRLRPGRGDDPRPRRCSGRSRSSTSSGCWRATTRICWRPRAWDSGTLLLLGWLAATGKLSALSSMSVEQWRWVALTGVLLTRLRRHLVRGARARPGDGRHRGARLRRRDHRAAGRDRRLEPDQRARRAADRARLRARRRDRPPYASGRTEARQQRRSAMTGRDTRVRCCSRATPTRPTRSVCAEPIVPARCSSTVTARVCDPGLAEVARSFDGAWPYLSADRPQQPHRRPARRARGRGLLGRQRTARPGPRR